MRPRLRQLAPIPAKLLHESPLFAQGTARQAIRNELQQRAVYVFEGVRVPDAAGVYTISVGGELTVEIHATGSDGVFASYAVEPFELNVARRVDDRLCCWRQSFWRQRLFCCRGVLASLRDPHLGR